MTDIFVCASFVMAKMKDKSHKERRPVSEGCDYQIDDFPPKLTVLLLEKSD